MKTKLLVIFLSVLLCSCGGGGGGGGGSSSGGGRTSSSSTGVRLLHGAIDAPPITAETSAAPGQPIDQVRFNQASFYADLGEGAQTLTVHTTDNENVSNLPVTVQKGEHRSALVYGTRQTFGIHAVLLDDVLPELDGTSAAIRVVHALAGAATISGSFGGKPLSAPVGFGGASEYITVPAGIVAVDLARAVDGHKVVSQTQTLAAGKTYSLMVTGEVNYLVFTDFMDDD